MRLENKKIGFAMTGSFCTFKKAVNSCEEICRERADVFPIMSENAYSTDTRFGNCKEFQGILKSMTGKDIIKSIKDAEPIGPKKLLDLVIVLPCTGNTLAKLANGITDTSVTMAVKAHLRNERPILLGVSTNDGLANAARNIGTLFNNKNIFFIPFAQDDCIKKPRSLVADFSKVIPAAEAALDGIQLQPMLSV